jgi:hypothetical protein
MGESAVAGLRTETRVVQAIGGVIVVLPGAVICQLLGLRGELSELRGALGVQIAAIEQRLTRIDGTLLERNDRVKGLEQRPAARDGAYPPSSAVLATRSWSSTR